VSHSRSGAGRVLLVVASTVVATLGGVSSALAQTATSTYGQQLQGTWVLVSVVNESNGKSVEPFGPHPRGLLILTPDGRFSWIVMRASLPRFASSNRMTGTAQENEAIVRGSMAYFGRYVVASEKDHTVNLTHEGATFPNWDGSTQRRVMSLIGDELRVTNPDAAFGGTNTLVLKRAR